MDVKILNARFEQAKFKVNPIGNELQTANE